MNRLLLVLWVYLLLGMASSQELDEFEVCANRAVDVEDHFFKLVLHIVPIACQLAVELDYLLDATLAMLVDTAVADVHLMSWVV